MLIKIILGIAALGLGIWLGLPGRYEQNDRDIERAMDQGGARRNSVRKVFTPLDWFSRSKRGSARRREPSRFSTAAPRSKQDEGEEK